MRGKGAQSDVRTSMVGFDRFCDWYELLVRTGLLTIVSILPAELGKRRQDFRLARRTDLLVNVSILPAGIWQMAARFRADAPAYQRAGLLRFVKVGAPPAS